MGKRKRERQPAMWVDNGLPGARPTRWHCDFLGLDLHDVPDHSTISRTRRLIVIESDQRSLRLVNLTHT